MLLFQNEQTARGHELLQLRNDYREVKEQLDNREAETADLREAINGRDMEIEKLRRDIQKLVQSSITDDEPKSLSCNVRIDYLPEETNSDAHSNCPEDTCLNEQVERIHHINFNSKEDEIQGFIADCCLSFNGNCLEVSKLREEMELKRRDFEQERLIWAQEKEKVLKYQRQLQMNYIQMYRRTKALEAEVETLTIELELDKTGIKKKLPSTEITHTIEL